MWCSLLTTAETDSGLTSCCCQHKMSSTTSSTQIHFQVCHNRPVTHYTSKVPLFLLNKEDWSFYIPHYILHLLKMIQLHLSPNLLCWYSCFLTNRVQLAKVNDTYSNVGVPAVHTVHSLKCCNSSTLLSLLTDCDDPRLYQHSFDWLIEWCDRTSLIINTKKAEEIIFGLHPDCQLPSVKIHNVEIKQVPSYKYLGVVIDANLSLIPHIEYICNKILRYLLCSLRSFGASSQIICFSNNNSTCHVVLEGSMVQLLCEIKKLNHIISSRFVLKLQANLWRTTFIHHKKEHAYTCKQHFCWPLSWRIPTPAQQVIQSPLHLNRLKN